MAGHSKWSKAKLIKGPLDQKRGQFFRKLAQRFSVAARLDGGAPDANDRLRSSTFPARVDDPRTEGMATADASRVLHSRVTEESQKLAFAAKTHVQEFDPGVSAQVMRCIDALEDSDHVPRVDAHFSAAGEALAKSVG